MRRLIMSIVFLMTAVFFVYGSGDGEQGRTGSQLLRLNMSARSIALGGGGIAIADHIDSMSMNPAGIADVEIREIMLSHQEMFDDVRAEYVAYTQRFFGIAVGMDLRGFYFGMDEYDSAGAETGKTLSVYNIAGSFGIGLPLGENIKLGASLTGLYEYYGDDVSDDINWGVNGGFRADLLDGRLSAGASFRNASNERVGFIDEENRSYPMPLLYNAGLAYRFKNSNFQDIVIVCLDTEIYWDRKMVPSAGVEYYPKEWFVLRTGYRHNEEYDEMDNFSFGFGLTETIKNVSGTLDYAYSVYGDLGATHKIAYTIRW